MPSHNLRYVLFLIMAANFLLYRLPAQSVGLVLSGGGSNGLAHVGVIKALEEHNIPIDYITGTSVGAFVGAMYASGYTIEEIEAFFVSEEFQRMVKGEVDASDRYFFHQSDPSAEMVKFKISTDKPLSASLPTNIIQPAAVDFTMLEVFARPAAAANYCFDSLMIPFRCVAADVDQKQEVIFYEGNLSTAVRASFTYPFYIKPIRIEGKLLFDGGLYNNFPHDIMRSTYQPDFMIGSKVTSNDPPPDEDDLLSQIKAMFISKTDFNLRGPGVIIEPTTNRSTFDFTNPASIIDSGYVSTLRLIDSLRQLVSRRVSVDERSYKRNVFLSKQPVLRIDSTRVTGFSGGSARYVHRFIWGRRKKATPSVTKMRFFNTTQDERIYTLMPTAHYSKYTGLYNLVVEARKEKPLHLHFGGNISNRPISTGYAGLTYLGFKRVGWRIHANTYFGRFYNSAYTKSTLIFPGKVPVELFVEGGRNLWNYFTSSNFFFEDQRPSYLVQKENCVFTGFSIPFSRHDKFTASYGFALQNDEYYQIKSFTSKDTPDETELSINTFDFEYEYNTHNRIQYANQGMRFKIRATYSLGDEITRPGTTSSNKTPIGQFHDWWNFNGLFDLYYIKTRPLKLGMHLEGNVSTQNLFANYTASILKTPAFKPTPESRTLFLESFHKYDFAVAGHNLVLTIMRDFDLRFSVFAMQSFRGVAKNNDGTQTLDAHMNTVYGILMGALVYNSPVGPVSFSTNYYSNVPKVLPEDKTPLTFFFHFGYTVFNRSSIDGYRY